MGDARVYRLDGTYQDRKAKTDPNEFVRWLGIRNSGGMRELMTAGKRRGDVTDMAALILISRHVHGSGYNPWEDVIDRNDGRIWYWGDAKAHATKLRDDFRGNQWLLRIWDAINTGRFADVPPILHFSKHQKGEVVFNGLCVLRDLEEAWFDDGGLRVRNYRAVLEILPVEEVSVGWLHARRDRADGAKAPPAWRTYARTGDYTRLRAYVSRVRSRPDQLPPPGTDAWNRLEHLQAMDPFAFERFTVAMFEKLEVAHQIAGTRAVRDGGFDFHGSFKLPPPVGYTVNFKGECKRYRPSLTGTGGVGPKDVARLVARLQRGEHGLFVTTGHYTRACQEEVYADSYPVELISGGQLVGMASQLGMRVG